MGLLGTRGSRRDEIQVGANGLWAALGALLAWNIPTVGWGILTGSLAAAQADTWSTELGARAKFPPRLITTGRPVPAGTSGGVTPLGTAGGVIGAIVMAMVAVGLDVPGPIFTAAIGGGIVGMATDSLLGASVQGKFRCVHCNVPTEASMHGCGKPTRLTQGRRWCTNDLVNLAGTGAGAVVGAAAGWIELA